MERKFGLPLHLQAVYAKMERGKRAVEKGKLQWQKN